MQTVTTTISIFFIPVREASGQTSNEDEQALRGKVPRNKVRRNRIFLTSILVQRDFQGQPTQLYSMGINPRKVSWGLHPFLPPSLSMCYFFCPQSFPSHFFRENALRCYLWLWTAIRTDVVCTGQEFGQLHNILKMQTFVHIYIIPELYTSLVVSLSVKWPWGGGVSRSSPFLLKIPLRFSSEALIKDILLLCYLDLLSVDN